MTGGRPLRFLMLVTCGWTTIRVLLLWEASGSLPDAIRGIPIPRAIAGVIDERARDVIVAVPEVRPLPAVAGPVRGSSQVVAVTVRRDGAHAGPIVEAVSTPSPAVLASGDARRRGDAVEGPQNRFVPSARAIDVVDNRLSFSSWMIARAGGGLGASLSAPQLGGTQGGIRADYAIGGGLAVTGRVAAPAAGAGREASLGVAWRPAGVPLRFVAEQRVALDGRRGGPALGVSGGISELPLPVGFRLEGYAQAGAILRYGVEHYVDGSVRMARPLAELGGLQLDAGAGAWGGAQRGVARVDIGPSIGVRAPIAGRTVRLSVDWRQRVAGSARPGSGPALSLGSDF